MPCWRTDKGYFQQQQSEVVRWLEFSKDGTQTFTYHEVASPSPTQVVLYDTSRKIYVKLTSDKMYWSRELSGQWSALATGCFDEPLPQEVPRFRPQRNQHARALNAVNFNRFIPSGSVLVFILYFCLFFAVIGGTLWWKGSRDSMVVELTAKTFATTEAMKPNDKAMFVKFHAPWCSHCKELAPVWDDLALVVSKHLVVAALDGDAYPNVLSSQGIRGFPTLTLYRFDHEPVNYSGARDVHSMIQWLIKMEVLPKNFEYDREMIKERMKERERKKKGAESSDGTKPPK
eukprot:c9728_g1_i1.p1 GENE.c9728_g1_i1~~c9728_g1_i1.p1  ORF type:complete len:288 (-),score=46.85 c9728_g1_i1:307-1170(-)